MARKLEMTPLEYAHKLIAERYPYYISLRFVDNAWSHYIVFEDGFIFPIGFRYETKEESFEEARDLLKAFNLREIVVETPEGVSYESR